MLPHRLVAILVVVPLDQLYEYTGVPPLMVGVAEPSQSPKQVAFVPARETVKGAGWVTETESVIEQPFLSVTVTT